MADEWKAFADDFLAKMGGPKEAAAVRKWEAQQAELRRQSALREGEFPALLVADLESPKLNTGRHPIPEIVKALDAGQRMVLLAGPPGTGKTVAAAHVIQHLRGAFFVRVPDYLTQLQSYKTQWQAERATLRSALLLDELGEEADHHRASVDHLLSGRYNLATHCTTIATTNMQLDDFRKAYGERIVDRFRDPRYCAVITCRDTVRPKRGKR